VVSLADVLTENGVLLGRHAADKHDAIARCGALLLALGAVAEPYLPAMHEREASVSTYIGEGVAIPHGTDAARVHVRHTALAVVQFPDGVDWGDGQRARMCIGIAADGDEHLRLLASLAAILLAPGRAATLVGATDVATVLTMLHSTDDSTDSTDRSTDEEMTA
jgi:PTS system mannitol-specific IIA component/phosphocarrier protein FPr